MGDQFQNGIFYGGSETRHSDILDGSSNTILLGERSAHNISESTWTGVVRQADFAAWRVVGWTGEPPNHQPPRTEDDLHFHGFAQFNSAHVGGMAMFAMADGSVLPLSSGIEFDVFYALGTIKGRESDVNFR